MIHSANAETIDICKLARAIMRYKTIIGIEINVRFLYYREVTYIENIKKT